MIAKQQELIDGGADAVGSRFHQAQTQLPRGIGEAVEVAGQLALRGHDHEPGGVRKLVCGSIVGIPKTHGRSQPLDRLRLAGEEMPAVGCPRTAVALQVLRLFRCRHCRGVARINAHDEHVKLLPDGPWEHPQAGEQRVEH